LVEPPAIDRTLGEHLVANGLRQFACSETQKFGHVTYFWNGNKSGYFDASLETYEEVPSDRGGFDERPWMKAAEIVDATLRALKTGRFDHVRLNFANGDMVGHTGDLEAILTSGIITDEDADEIVRCAQVVARLYALQLEELCAAAHAHMGGCRRRDRPAVHRWLGSNSLRCDSDWWPCGYNDDTLTIKSRATTMCAPVRSTAVPPPAAHASAVVDAHWCAQRSQRERDRQDRNQQRHAARLAVSAPAELTPAACASVFVSRFCVCARALAGA
jgi:hypothetical protein